MDESTIKQVFFQSDRPRKNALIADEVDIVQFAQNIAALVRVRAAQTEHRRCVNIISQYSPELSRELAKHKP
jgi:hypothetical protein